MFTILRPFYNKHHLESSSKELLADNEEPSLINDEVHNNSSTRITKDETSKDNVEPVFKKVIETEKAIIEITRNF